MAERVAVVTGAGRGIGREIARRLAARGHAVLCTDVALEGAQETASLAGGGAWAMALDVREPGAHRAAAAAASERGRLAVWVNSAGVLRTVKAWEHPDDDVRLLVEANLLGTIWGCRAAIEHMRAGGGRIVNMVSMSAFGPVPGLAVYGATKHAVLGFTESLQGDLREAGIPIRALGVCPDGVDTGMVRERAGDPDAAIIHSGRRMLTPDEVAERIVEELDTSRVLLTIPRSRAAAARLSGLAPRLGLAAAPLLKRVGQRKLSR